MNLEDIMLSEINRSQKDKYSVIPLICTSRSQIHRDREWNGGCRGLWRRKNKEFNGYGVSISKDEKVLKMDIGDSCTTV